MKDYPESYFFDFESLELYKKSLDYVDFVYDCTKCFPKEELFGLTSQFRNAANSTSLNISDGIWRVNTSGIKIFKDNKRFC